MRFSNTLIPTLKETPVEAHIVSHQLMLRAGLIRQLGAGIYTWLPLGLRVLRKVESIVRREMDATGAQEVLMPAVQPGELWQESGRWEQYGRELLRFVDRHDRSFCFGPTHEEVIVDLARRELRSYKQLPVNFYQIQTKFRDEIRPRFGIMRGREFLMKDAYSFDLDETSLAASYQSMFDCYQRIFERCGLAFRAVEADTGAIGGASSHEFHVLAGSGEDLIASCDRCGYAANLEKARSIPQPLAAADGDGAARQQVPTPGQKSIEQVAAFLQVPVARMIKSLVVRAGERHVLLLLRGDHELNPVKAANALKTPEITLPEPHAVLAVSGGVPVGSLGPVGSALPVLADEALRDGSGLVCGANVADHHLTGVAWGRDLPVPDFADLRNVAAGEGCPRCDGGRLALDRGIEVGHVFKLGDKYSRAMGVTVLDQDGRERTPVMGCYGIGVSRIVAAAIEQNHDDNGILWPDALAPFQVQILLVSPKDEAARAAAETLHDTLNRTGIEALLDDRDERLGVKFKDADLIGCPWRVVVGGRGLQEGKLEVQSRQGGIKEGVAVDQVVPWLAARVHGHGEAAG